MNTYTITTPANENLGTLKTTVTLPVGGEKEARNLQCLNAPGLIDALVKLISAKVGYPVRIVRCIPSKNGNVYVSYCHAGDAKSPVKVTAHTRQEAAARNVPAPKVPAVPATPKAVAPKAVAPKPKTEKRVAVSTLKTTRTLTTNQKRLVTMLLHERTDLTERQAIALVVGR